MSDWEEKFKQFSTIDPKMNHLPPGTGTNFWETLYQMFKARLEAEAHNEQDQNP